MNLPADIYVQLRTGEPSVDRRVHVDCCRCSDLWAAEKANRHTVVGISSDAAAQLLLTGKTLARCVHVKYPQLRRQPIAA